MNYELTQGSCDLRFSANCSAVPVYPPVSSANLYWMAAVGFLNSICHKSTTKSHLTVKKISKKMNMIQRNFRQSFPQGKKFSLSFVDSTIHRNKMTKTMNGDDIMAVADLSTTTSGTMSAACIIACGEPQLFYSSFT